jgi:hypothetical protein
VSLISEQSPVVCLSKSLPRKDQFEIAARYLQYQRYRCPNCNTLLKPNEIEHHVCPNFRISRNERWEWCWHLMEDGQIVAESWKSRILLEECLREIELVKPFTGMLQTSERLSLLSFTRSTSQPVAHPA